MRATDAELIQQVLQGNLDAFSELMARYQDFVHGQAYHLVENFEDARDVAQETFVRAYLHLEQLRDPERLGPWLRRITRRVGLDWLERRHREAHLSLEGVQESGFEPVDTAPSVVEQVSQRQVEQALLVAIQRLSESYRLPLTLFYLNGLSYEGVADFLELPVGTVRMRLHRARRMLQEELQCLMEETFTQARLEPQSFQDSVRQRLQHWVGQQPQALGTQWIATWIYPPTPRQAERKLCLPAGSRDLSSAPSEEREGGAEAAVAEVEKDAQDPAAWTRLGRARLAQGDLKGAQAALRRAGRLAPEDPAGWNNQGVVEECRDNLDAALELYQRAHRAAPEDPQIGCNFAAALHSIGREEEALAVLGRVLEAHLDCAQVHYRMGRIWSDRGDLERALQHAAAIPAGGSSLYGGDRLRGSVALRQNRREEARRYFQAALQQGEEPELLNQLALVSSPAEAVGLYRRAAELDPAYLGGWNNLGETYREMRRYREAEAAYQQVLASRPRDTLALANLGYHLYPEMGRWDEALQMARKHDRLIGGYAGWGVGLLLERAGREGAALQHARRLAQRTGRYVLLRLVQVRRQVARGNWEKARALWPDPNTAWEAGDWECLSATGWAYARRERWEEAQYFFQWALREQPLWARWFHAYLSSTYRAAGDCERAREHAQAAVDLDDHFAPGWTELGLAWEAEGNRPAAQEAYRRARAVDPYCPVTQAALERLEKTERKGEAPELPGPIEWLW